MLVEVWKTIIGRDLGLLYNVTGARAAEHPQRRRDHEGSAVSCCVGGRRERACRGSTVRGTAGLELSGLQQLRLQRLRPHAVPAQPRVHAATVGLCHEDRPLRLHRQAVDR